MTISFRRLVLVLALGCASLVAFATDDPREADHVALRALRDKITAAIDKQDLKALSSCFAKEFAFTTVTQTVLTNEAQVQAFFDRMFRSDGALVTAMKTEPTADILTRFIDANTGICYGSTKDTYTMKSGKTVEMNLRWSATVVKENGEWKVALAHVGTDFLNNPVTEGLTAFTKKVGIGAGLGGLLLGFLLCRIFGRRKPAA
ncbi:MAG: nuclear transport factor 2 family protein [Opitutaceae bacterium]|nr:nuclear transport factor 2 family protein [Opitutaceae bacterium]